MLLVPVQFFLRDLSPGAFCRVDSDLLQSQKIRPGIHHTAGNQNGRHIHSANAHQMGRNCLIAAGNEYTAVKGCGACVDLDEIRNGIPAGKGIIDAIMSLSHSVTDICGKVPGGFSAFLRNSRNRRLHQFQQMGAARMAVTEGTFHHDLGF